MQREIVNLKPGVGPGNMSSDYPTGTFNSARSKRARSKYKKIEHQHARSIVRQDLKRTLANNFPSDN